MKGSIRIGSGLAVLLILLAGCAGYEAATEMSPDLPHEEAAASTGGGTPSAGEPVASESNAGAMVAEAAPGSAQDVAGVPAAEKEAMLEQAEDLSAEVAEPEAYQKAQPEAAAREAAALRQPTVRYLSADDSNSAASPVIVRRIIQKRRAVHPAVVRTYEFLNYYSFDYEAPMEQPIRIVPQLRALDEEGSYSLQVAVRAQDRFLAELPPFNLTFLLDTSGSMAGEPLELAKALILGIVSRLRPQDRLSLITCNRKTEVLFSSEPVGRLPQERLAEILGQVRANDVTDLEAGIARAYETASQNYDYRTLNRVVLLSDGAANAGELAADTIARHAEDSDRQGIYLAGIGVGEGFNDQLMNTVTDRGRGAYLFVDSQAEIDRILREDVFIASFDLAVKDVRLKMVMPAGWKMEEFHGEQVSARAEDIVPQYLSPNDQMIYHLTVSSDLPLSQAGTQEFEFEAEYAPIGARRDRLAVKSTVAEMLAREKRQILKGDAVVAYAEMLKSLEFPLDAHRRENVDSLEEALQRITEINEMLKDPELEDIVALLELYGETLRFGEKFPGSRDGQDSSPEAVLGLDPSSVLSVRIIGDYPDRAVQASPRLLASERLVPMEGYQFLLLSSGPVGNPYPAGSGQLSGRTYPDPAPSYMGNRRLSRGRQQVYDLHRIRLELRAPGRARSFSFDFNFFSSEFPEYVNQNFNDTFYAVLEAASTNNGQPTNIAFDANNNSIEVDNNYFQNPFHPIPNAGTGFDYHGSTGWLRTSWPIRGGEQFTLTFSIHDEGDGIYDSLVVLDNFRWHGYDAVGTTDPLN
ncbi:MAG: von Willebrand factor type A domain-containing protein [Spirochaetaceae bacterium]|nr:MAG: von Willebrand factor type A domain-containing protein [Spirochaetaceae bacterium]